MSGHHYRTDSECAAEMAGLAKLFLTTEPIVLTPSQRRTLEARRRMKREIKAGVRVRRTA